VTLAVAFSLMLALPVGTSARTSRDLCAGGYQDPQGAQLACEIKEQIPAHRTWEVPTNEGLGQGRFHQKCADGWKVRGTTNLDSPAVNADWDFWSFRGEWVTWNGLIALYAGSVLVDPREAKSIRVGLHNWSSWGWDVKVFWFCDRIPTPRLGLDGEVLFGETEGGDTDGEELPGLPDEEPPGSPGDDELPGTPGDDEEFGGEGDDDLAGGPGDDFGLAGEGDDTIHGEEGDDQLLGGAGDDEAFGGPGSDELFDDQGADALAGGSGNDRFSARDRRADRIDCGPGKDIVIADPRDDIARSCEIVYLRASDEPSKPPRN
jgi:hypothetical protein